MATNPDALLAMSDDDIADMSAPPVAEEPAAPASTPAPEAPAALEAAPAPVGSTEGQPPAATPAVPTAGEPTPANPLAVPDGQEGDKAPLFTPGQPAPDLVKDKPAEAPKPGEPAKPAAEGEPAKTPDAAAAGSNDAAPVIEVTPEQAVDFYKQIMAPFKANGKTIELRSPEEARQLMQMGANYTKKLQALQPHRKLLMMLENNGLMDEGKLSFLIDVDKKDPEAIKKLIRDSGVDPLEIDTSTEPAYTGGHHQVGDEEVAFRTTVEDLVSTPEGAKTVADVNATWDQTSKQAIWASPEILTVIHQQRENGIYDVITAEVDRQKTLGTIAPNTPFLEAYKNVGDAMARAALGGANTNGNVDAGTTVTPVPGQATPAPQILETRVAAPKSNLSNGDAASAASPTRTGGVKTPMPMVNPLAESDEAFLKRMENRL